MFCGGKPIAQTHTVGYNKSNTNFGYLTILETSSKQVAYRRYLGVKNNLDSRF